MRDLDEQETKIVAALIHNPRLSDNRLGDAHDIPVRTVSRKRARLEKEGLVRYYAELDTSGSGSGHYPCSHLYIIRFKVGITAGAVSEEIRNEPKVVTVFTRSIQESFIAELDGKVALVMVVMGTSDADIVRRVQEDIVPSLHKTHGEDAIEGISTIRLLERVRILRNYLPAVNVSDGRMNEDWSIDSICVV